MNLVNNGERLMTMGESKTKAEHLHRYSIALEYVKNKIVLDIASGEGYGSSLLSNVANQVIGVDISKEAVQHARKKYTNKNLSFLEGNAADIPLPDNSIDVVVSFETIEHHDKHDEMIKECVRVLKKEGLLIISSPDKKYYSEIPNHRNPFHIKELYKADFIKLISKYFPTVNAYNQGFLNCSLVYNDNCMSKSEMKIYSGDFERLVVDNKISSPEYNIIIAGFEEIETTPTSIFEFGNTFEDSSWKDKYFDISNSYSYRVGYLIISPIRFLKSLFKFKNRS
jgi:ubiquinone/menaquinone biosynthesis C-methylase UbiE